LEFFYKDFNGYYYYGIAGFIALNQAVRLFANDFFGVLLQFIFVCVISGIVYLFMTYLLKSPEINFVLRYLKKIKNHSAN